MESKIDLSRVYKLYEKIVQLEQFFIPTKGWSSILPDGTDVRNGDLYYELIPNATSSNEISPDIRERLVQRCLDAGATHVQFKCTDKNREYCYPDYKISELQYIDLNLDMLLEEGAKCAEVFELQRVIEVFEDGIFGKHTLNKLRLKTNKASISLNELKSLRYTVEISIPISKLWWLNK